MDYIVNAIRGFWMAIADSVPGVSGGTVAFILGFYDQFINSLDDLAYGNLKKKKTALLFLIKLGIGWIIGMILAVLLLSKLFENHIYSVSSLFIGFIIFSIPLIIKEEKNNLHNKYQNIIFTLIGIIIVSLITYFNPITSNSNFVDITHLNIGLVIYIFIAASISISAMVLPGISGSTLLLIFGLYMPIISGIKELLHFNFSYFPALFIFGLGIITGIVLIIRLLKIALNKYRSASIYLILGLMIGSLYAIVMGPTTMSTSYVSLSIDNFSIPFFIMGGVVILVLEIVKKMIKDIK